MEIKPLHQTFILNLLNDLEIFVFNGDMNLVYTHLMILDMPMNYVRLSDQLPIYIPNIFECKITEHFAS